MLSNIVKDGDKVELQSVEFFFDPDKPKPKTYTTRVFTVLSDDKLELVMPMEKTKLILLPVDGEYALCFYTDQGLYQCFARIYDRYKSNNVYVLALELTSNLRKHQRREYYRFSCVIDMKARELKKEEADSLSTPRPFFVPGLPLRRCLICDISGGGMRFITDIQYEDDSYIYCYFPIKVDGAMKEYETVCKVLSSKELDNRPGEYEHRTQYVNLDRDSREEIIKYIFEEERRLRRNVKK